MKARLRQPLFWIVLVELVLMSALFVVAWRVYEAHRTAILAAPAPVLSAVRPSETPPPAARAPAAVKPSPTAPKAKPTPGFPVDVAELNREQGALERLQSGLVVRLMDAARAYIETVVLPAVRRAESASRASTAAAAQSPAAIRKMP